MRYLSVLCVKKSHAKVAKRKPAKCAKKTLRKKIAKFKFKELLSNTIEEYKGEIRQCREIFIKKNQDYGPSWRILRIPSLIDQIYIKAQRIRSIEEKKLQKIGDSIEGEFRGIINYCIITIIQLQLGETFEFEDHEGKLLKLYDAKALEAENLMMAKNHDYGEAWRQMYSSSFTDLILSKILRIKQILENDGMTVASEGIDANLFDMINYAVFALIRISETSDADR